ncbi:hypothetical protein B0T18DRAFT_437521 [Schizothecium vesticola]|uniref:Uncharacterized protein n=1 Tax=Schizothecium vesticola TaxID=314040 RepID=A0AA40F344_9PEZI|nr:hypothetical protein B0T18DRAFT_437521 [Schizothecium vesticola]
MAELFGLIEDFIPSSNDDGLPSYREATTSSSSHHNPASSSNTTPSHHPPTASSPGPLSTVFISPIAAHFDALPSRLRAAQNARASDQAARDLDTITLLVPAIEAFLRDLDVSPAPVAELTLVPASSVPRARGWVLSDGAERRREGEVVRVIRVDDLAETKLDSKSPTTTSGEKGRPPPPSTSHDDDDEEETSSRVHKDARANGFDAWGRFDDASPLDAPFTSTTAPPPTFFTDEDIARRLASYLEPKAEVKVERRAVQAAVEPSSSRWRWGGRKKEERGGFAAVTAVSAAAPGLAGTGGGGVKVTVRAEEVTFRRENEIGLWESLSGFGVVVRVRGGR